MVEMAIALPVILLLILAAIEGGYFAFSYLAIDSATHEGARRAVLASATTTEVTAKVVSAARPLVVVSANVAITVNGGAKTFSARTFGDRIRVSTQYLHRPLVAMAFGPGIHFTFNGRAELMVE